GNATLQSDIINSGSGALSLSNTGNASIGANIKNEGSGSLSINNTGKVSDTTKIESNGSGKVEVQEWLVSANSKGEVKPLEITGSNLSVVSVSNVTFDAGNITNLSSLVNDPKNVINIDTSKDTSISNPAEINSKVFAKAEFKTNDPSVNINLDAVSKTLSFSIDGAKTSAAALGKTLISNTQARANFVNSVMGNAMNAVHLIHNQGSANVYSNFNKAYEEGAIYANFDNLASDALLRTSSENKDKNHLAFMLPYISKSDTSLNGGLTSKGHTKGVIFGYSYLNPNNKDIYGIYGGYDDFSSKTYPSDILALNNRTYYAGVRYYHPFNYKDYELFSKFSSQFGLIQNDIYERVGQTEFKGEPKSYAYDANVNMGMNIKLNTKHTLTPEIGLGYNGGYSKAYTMNNAINTITR
ncbi:autotransporter outer membrane beta-barrel domain-containing protein, partial [Helicobacter apodemus]